MKHDGVKMAASMFVFICNNNCFMSYPQISEMYSECYRIDRLLC